MQSTSMESVGSNSPPAAFITTTRSPRSPRHTPTHHLADRIIRALRHALRLLHRSGTDYFFILGATGNVYTVTLSPSPSCSCPDRTVPCKHILFVYLRVLRLPFADACLLLRRTLPPSQLARLRSSPTAPDALAGARARERFHQLFSGSTGLQGRRGREVEEGTVCPVCLEVMEITGGAALVTCGTCGNSLHGECLARWKRARGRRAASCVVCRARWRERRAQEEQYVNLAAYISDDAAAEGGGGSGGLCVT